MLASDLTALSSFLKTNFNYDTGSFDPPTDNTPQKRGMLRSDLNINANHKFSFNYLQLNSSSDNILSGSTSAGIGRRQVNTDYMNYQNSNYAILENRKTTTGELNSVIGSTMSNSLRVTYSSSDEGRPQSDVLFPFVDILLGGSAYTSFGSEPFTPNNELRLQVVRGQERLHQVHAPSTSSRSAFRVERYHSDNVFFNCCKQGAWVYNSLDDFYADARDALANPEPHDVAGDDPRSYQIRYMNMPGLDKPSQPLTAIYGGAYAQDVWRPRSNLSITAGLRFDVPAFENTAYNNPNANALTFRDENGQAVQYDSGKMPGANILWSPRFGFNYDLAGDQKTQLRGGTGVFTGQPLYVWISNQLGNTGMLQGSVSADTTSNQSTAQFPFSTNVDRYKPAAHRRAGHQLRAERHRQRLPLPAGVAQQHRRRPPPARRHHRHRGVHVQPRRQRHLLHQRQPAGGADGVRRRRHPSALDQYPHQQRHRQPGHGAIVMKNQDIGRNWNLAFSASEADVARPVAAHRLQLRRSEEHHRSGLNGQRVVEQQPDAWRSQQPRPRLLDLVSWPPLLPVGVPTPSSTSASARRRSRRSGRAAPSATPATSSRPTPTATAARRTT